MRLLVRPRQLSIAARSAIASSKLDRRSRGGQVERLRREIAEEPAVVELRRWLADAAPVANAMGASRRGEFGVTGFAVIDVDHQDLGRLRSELPGLVVIEDRPIELIQPKRREAVAGSAPIPPSDLWHLDRTGVARARRNGMKEAGQGVTVAVLDTGVDAVPEIEDRLRGGYVLDVEAWSVTAEVPHRDTDGHGTHVSGLIAGRTVGIAPAAGIVSLTMIPEGRGTLSNFVLAMEWVAVQGEIAVVNMSAGLLGYVAELEDAVTGLQSVGVLACVAIGNEGAKRTRSPGNVRGALSVGACTRDDKVAGFSSSGTIVANGESYEVPDLVAPGAEIVSCVRDGGFEAWDGSSMATPIVAGIAALCLERYPGIAVLDLHDAIVGHCERLKGVPRQRQGAGCATVPFPWETSPTRDGA